MCKKSTKNDHLHYIPQVELLTPQSKYDGVHLRDWGVKQLVCNIKAIVNPLLGFPGTPPTKPLVIPITT